MNRLVALGLVALALASAHAWSRSAGPTANPYRAYPPSCLADPLPAVPSGPTWSALLTVNAQITGTQQLTTEQILLTFWRVPCDGGKAALLGLFQRTSANNGRLDVVPEFPGFIITQGTTTLPSTRVAREPNTVRGIIDPGGQLFFNTQFVFENFPTPGFPQIDFNQSFNLTVNGLTTASGPIPAYDSTQYPDASLPLPISGYLSGNYFDPAHGGEGVEIFVGFDTGTSRLITAAWYTYDSTGTPFWLFAQGGFNAGDTSATLNVVYATGGGFAGNFGPNASNHPWGTMTVSFPDCGTLHFQYQANAGLPSSVPQGSGTKTWIKLFGQNGLTCE